MGFKQTGNGGCHTRQNEIDACLLLLCPYNRELVLLCTQFTRPDFTTPMMKPLHIIAGGRRTKPATFKSRGKLLYGWPAAARQHKRKQTWSLSISPFNIGALMAMICNDKRHEGRRRWGRRGGGAVWRRCSQANG